MIFYTADLHLGHDNIIKHCERPFSGAKEMNQALIDNWNEVVSNADTVYILGDFAFRSKYSMKPVLRDLKGTKHLILGNHDVGWMKNLDPRDFFASVSDIKQIDDTYSQGDIHITLCHYPMLSWNRREYGAIHVYGHIHNNTKGLAFETLRRTKALNAGVEVNDYRPVTLDQLIANNIAHYWGNPAAAAAEGAPILSLSGHPRANRAISPDDGDALEDYGDVYD
jgi:calcineurin-like phosphoesterase family protein